MRIDRNVPQVDTSQMAEAGWARRYGLLKQLAKLLSMCRQLFFEKEPALLIQCKCISHPWLIYFLDDTKEFIARNEEFTVNIALIEEGCRILGVVFAPATYAFYWAGTGSCEFWQLSGQTVAINTTPAKAGRVGSVVASKSCFNKSTQAAINPLSDVSLVQGGTSLKFSRVAEGWADFTFGWHTYVSESNNSLGNIRRQKRQFGRECSIPPSLPLSI